MNDAAADDLALLQIIRDVLIAGGNDLCCFLACFGVAVGAVTRSIAQGTGRVRSRKARADHGVEPDTALLLAWVQCRAQKLFGFAIGDVFLFAHASQDQCRHGQAAQGAQPLDLTFFS